MEIHIFNLSKNIIESDIKKIFSAFGEVTKAIIKRDAVNSRSTGYAFVSMASTSMAKQAIQQLDQTLIDGRRITLSEARYSISKCFN